MNGFLRVLLSDAKISGMMVFLNMMKTMKRGMKVANVEEVKNKKIGDEGRWNEIVIAIVYAAIKRALNNNEMYSAIL